MNTELMFSSKNDCWATPQDFFDELNKIYHFDIDVCASSTNAKCEKYISPEINSLSINWQEGIDKNLICWMNPPYGRAIGLWVRKAYEESLKGCTVVCLLPARTDTRWYHDYCVQGDIKFIKGRLIFGTDEYWNWVWDQEFINGKSNSLYRKYGRKNPAPFPSMLVVFNPNLN